MQPQQIYDFSSDENSHKWRGLFVQALRKVIIITTLLQFDKIPEPSFLFKTHSALRNAQVPTASIVTSPGDGCKKLVFVCM